MSEEHPGRPGAGDAPSIRDRPAPSAGDGAAAPVDRAHDSLSFRRREGAAPEGLC